MSAAGSIEEVTIKNRRFAVAADAEVNRKLGGYEVSLEANGDGSVREVMTRVPFKLDSIVVSIDDNNGDAEFLQEICDTPGLVPVTITYVSQKVYQGVGKITGEVVVSSMNTTATITLEGQAKLTIQ